MYSSANEAFVSAKTMLSSVSSYMLMPADDKSKKDDGEFSKLMKDDKSSSLEMRDLEKPFKNDQAGKEQEQLLSPEEEEARKNDEAFDRQYFIWALMYMIGFMVHCRKKHNDNVLVVMAHICGYITTYHKKGFTDAIFLSFVAWSFYHACESSPHNANHLNICGFVSFLILPQQIRRCYYGGNAKKAGTADALNVVRIAVIIMYFMAGFHKLNSDFLNPTVSCAYDKVNKYFRLVGIHKFDHNMHWFLLTVPHQVLVIEFVPPILLLFQKTRRYAVITLILLHTILLPVGFADFGSIAQSFLFLFISPRAAATSKLPTTYYIDMAWAFLVLEAITYVIWAQTDAKIVPLKYEEVALVLLAYILHWGSTLRTDDTKYPGPKVYIPKTLWSRFAIGFFWFFTMNPYLGLRTVGCLTMFSNLRTEGPTSNHLLLGSNPLKIFSYQEDFVEALHMDKRLNRKLDVGYKLPKITFETDVAQKAMEREYKNAEMTILYQGKVMETKDFLNDPDFEMFRQPQPFWIRKWMDFRPVPTEGPKECSW